MATVEQLAAEHYRSRKRLVRAAEAAAARAWGQVDRASIRASWAVLKLALLTVLTEAQRQAADAANTYVPAAQAAQGMQGDNIRVSTTALAGVASDGRSLATLLDQPVITTLIGLSQGMSVPQAMTAGGLSLGLITATQVADAGRVADGVAITGSRRGGYVRMLSPGACARCAVLAGRWYAYNAGFQRHPNCHCIGIPAAESIAGNFTTSPKAYFNSLNTADQDRIFTQAGAQAIRDGADIGQVVNARRGMYTAGGRSFTTESTTKRGVAPGHVRPMPEQIYRDARTREEAIQLLRQFGYLI